MEPQVSTSFPVQNNTVAAGKVHMQSSQPPSRKPWLSNSLADGLFAGLARGAAILTLALLMAIMVSLVIGAWPAIREYGLSFFFRRF